MDESSTATGTDEAAVDAMATARIQTTKSRRKPAHAAPVSEEPAEPITEPITEPIAEPWPPKATNDQDESPAVAEAAAIVQDEPEPAGDADLVDVPVEVEDAPEIELVQAIEVVPAANQTEAPADVAEVEAEDVPLGVPASAEAVASSSYVSSFSQSADSGVADLAAGVKAAGTPAVKKAASAAGAGVLALLVVRKGLRRRAKRHAG